MSQEGFSETPQMLGVYPLPPERWGASLWGFKHEVNLGDARMERTTIMPSKAILDARPMKRFLSCAQHSHLLNTTGFSQSEEAGSETWNPRLHHASLFSSTLLQVSTWKHLLSKILYWETFPQRCLDNNICEEQGEILASGPHAEETVPKAVCPFPPCPCLQP